MKKFEEILWDLLRSLLIAFRLYRLGVHDGQYVCTEGVVQTNQLCVEELLRIYSTCQLDVIVVVDQTRIKGPLTGLTVFL